jgi:hypothetical protein
MHIRELFDPSKDIHRAIEKVITYGASQENRLKSEISEYVVTDRIEDSFRKLLDNMQLAMEGGGERDVGVWVSGFYGSGKSSFTKYLGIAFDQSITVEGVPFYKHLQNRLKTAQVKAQLSTVVQRYPAAVILLDLASDMLAGNTLEDVSTVLYYKVLQWAGYSRNLKVAALERRVEKDGRSAEFAAKVETLLPGVTWKELQNDPLAVDALIPQVAHEMYPALFPAPSSFTSATTEIITFETERVEEMLDIVRRKTGKEHILFIVDEVGQYVGGRDNLILNLDGLAKNLKRIGNGKVWVFATAQQTLTEDDPRAALNSDKLYKLKDRFPIQVDLEASDIKEICTNRLLGKATSGQAQLEKLFEQFGPQLRANTKLQDAKYYDSDFSRTDFVNLYPFLPAHFSILLHLLGALAKSTGGIGLRSAIKVIQDILTEPHAGELPMADWPLGRLATTVTLYDALEKDIARAAGSLHQALSKVFIQYPDSPLHQEVGKTILVLQLLANMPVTVQNVAALMQPTVDGGSRLNEVRQAVEDMIKHPLVPLGEKDGFLTFLSEKLREVEQERGNIPPRSVDIRRITSDALRETFNPLPSVRLNGTLAVTAGLKLQSGSLSSSLAGERETVQTIVEFADASDHDTARVRLVDDSRQKANQNFIFLLGRSNPEVESLASEIYRCQEIANKYRNDADQEVKEYCADQVRRAGILLNQQLIPLVRRSLMQGSFIFRGQSDAVANFDTDLLTAAKKRLDGVASQVFNRYSEAPERVDTNLAERFLRVGNPAGINSNLDPLGLVQIKNGTPSVNSGHKAILSIHDAIEKVGTLEGKRLLENFSDAPFGWSQDTVRYILAAMLLAGEIKLKISGQEVIAVGQKAIDALKTNKSFANVGVFLRDERPPIEVLLRASERLTDLIGDPVIPLEQDISKAAAKYFPRFQHDYGPLAERLYGLGLAGVDKLKGLNQDIQDILLSDASDAPQRLGAEESPLYEALRWAADIKLNLDNGQAATVTDLQSHIKEIAVLPDTGVPGELKKELEEDLVLVSERLKSETFYQYGANLASQLTAIQARVRDAVLNLGEQLKQRRRDNEEDIQRLPDWPELTAEQKGNILSLLDTVSLEATEDLVGLKQLLARDYELNTLAGELKDSVRRQGQDNRRLREERELAELKKKGVKKVQRAMCFPIVATSLADLDALIARLQTLKTELQSQASANDSIEVSFTVGIQVQD